MTKLPSGCTTELQTQLGLRSAPCINKQTNRLKSKCLIWKLCISICHPNFLKEPKVFFDNLTVICTNEPEMKYQVQKLSLPVLCFDLFNILYFNLSRVQEFASIYGKCGKLQQLLQSQQQIKKNVRKKTKNHPNVNFFPPCKKVCNIKHVHLPYSDYMTLL